MLRVTVEVQGMQLQAVADTAAQFTLVSEEFNKSLDPAPPIRKEVAINTAGKGMQMDGYIAGLPLLYTSLLETHSAVPQLS
jgi:hypothetical protein